MISLKYYLKINYPFIFTIGIVCLGLILSIWATFFLIFKLESTPADTLIYLISFIPDPFEWIYKMIIWGNVLIISGLILLIYIVLFKRRKEVR